VCLPGRQSLDGPIESRGVADATFNLKMVKPGREYLVARRADFLVRRAIALSVREDDSEFLVSRSANVEHPSVLPDARNVNFDAGNDILFREC
jgi:hypothetical protein